MGVHSPVLSYIILFDIHFGNRSFGTVDIMGIDMLGADFLGIDFLGIDIPAPTPQQNRLTML